MIDVEKLLAPISPENPSGEDVSYAADFMELDTLVQGKEATQFSEAEEPDWKLIQRRCEEISLRSKHLQVLVILCLSSLKLDGIQGVAASLELLSKTLQNYWDTLYPQLDPDDNLDPLERVNIISGLASPIATYGDPYKYLEKLNSVPLCQSGSLGRLSFSSLPAKTAAGEKSNEVIQAEAAFRDTPPDVLQATFSAIERSIEAVAAIETFLDTTIGASKSPNLDPLSRQLKEIQKAVSLYSGATPSVSTSMETSSEISQGTPVSSVAVSAALPTGTVSGIHSRADVIKALDLICDYYRVAEPSSPIPLLVQRARRLVEGDFLTIINELAPESLANLRSVTGVKESFE